jgi:hypothetical protein
MNLVDAGAAPGTSLQMFRRLDLTYRGSRMHLDPNNWRLWCSMQFNGKTFIEPEIRKKSDFPNAEV